MDATQDLVPTITSKSEKSAIRRRQSVGVKALYRRIRYASCSCLLEFDQVQKKTYPIRLNRQQFFSEE